MYLTQGLSLITLCAITSMTSSFTPNAASTSTINMPTKRSTTYTTTPIVVSSPDITTNRHVCLDPFTTKRGGDQTVAVAAPRSNGLAILNNIANLVASFWAAGGFVAILAKSIKRILPLALEPFSAAAPALSTFQMLSYITMCLGFAYAEGYKGFQLKFSPLVVARAQTLKPFQGTPIHHVLFGPFYAMGLFHATKKAPNCELVNHYRSGTNRRYGQKVSLSVEEYYRCWCHCWLIVGRYLNFRNLDENSTFG